MARYLEHGLLPGGLADADVDAYRLVGRMIRHPRRAGESVESYLFRLSLPDQDARGNGHAPTRRTTMLDASHDDVNMYMNMKTAPLERRPFAAP